MDATSVGQVNFIAFRIKLRGCGTQPERALGSRILHGAECSFRLEDTAADHGPPRLIVVRVRGVHDPNFQAGTPFENACSSGYPCRPASYDQDITGFRIPAMRGGARQRILRTGVGRCSVLFIR